jgi:predicted esterase
MERTRVRRFGVKAVVCAVVGWVSLLSLARHAAADSAAPAVIELAATDELPGVVVFPARGEGAHPITVLLHGMCGDAARSCSHFAEQVTQTSNLVCPRASQRCSGGGVSWAEQGVAEAVEAAVTRAKAALGPRVEENHGRTLIGYSLGAYRALRIAESSAGKYPRVMLIGARIALDQARLTQNGVERVLLCAGDWDMMHDPMQREADRARRAGFQSRFLGLGPVGHTFTATFANYLPEALSWLRGS